MDTGARTRCDATLKSAEAGEDVAQLLREGASLIQGLGAARNDVCSARSCPVQKIAFQEYVGAVTHLMERPAVIEE